MHCEEVRRLIGPMLDGEIGETQMEQVEAHLTDCSLCQKIMESHQDLSRTIRRSVASSPVRNDLHHRVQSTIRKQKTIRSGYWSRIWPLVIALCIFVSFIVHRYQGS